MISKARLLSADRPLSRALGLAGFAALVLAACSQSNSPSDTTSANGGQAAGGSAGTVGAAAGERPASGGSDANAGGAAIATGGQSSSAGGHDANLGGAPDISGGGMNAVAGVSGTSDGAGNGGAGVAGGSAASAGSSGASSVGSTLPGDIATGAGTPLVAAHSMIRAMYASYNGKLFQVRRADGKTQDIGAVSAGGKVDASALSTFCSGSSCTIAALYDQSGNGNSLPQVDAASQMLLQYYTTPGGSKVPMAVTASRQYLRNRTNTTKIPKGAASQTEYFVVNTKFFNEKCCWDYGNMELVAKVSSSNTAGKMSALNIGTSDNGYANPGAGSGPWGMVDYEAGVYSGAYRIGQVNPNNPSLTWPIATVLTKSNGTTSWALKVGDASKGTLITAWNGALPSGYNPLKQEGGLSLGEGGDGSKLGTGAFFEGVVIADVTSDATDAAIQAGLSGIFK